MDFIIWLVIGAVAGWLAGTLVRGSGFGLIGDIVVGIIGGFIGGWLWPKLGLPVIGSAFISELITATVGAVILLLLIRLIRR
jgi:uncharacterized membrane protein YeaQ/YmgE (transglycosylase-associated protein family)